MEKENSYPSVLLLGADMWLLSTAIYQVFDMEVTEYTSLLNERQASELIETYQLALGSFQAKKLNLSWDPILNDYWVDPNEFLLWCIKKQICPESTLIDFYKTIVMKEPPYKLVDAFVSDPSKIAGFRKQHPATTSKQQTLALVKSKLLKNKQITLDELVMDQEIRSNAHSRCYSDATVRKWIQQACPQFRRPVGRPTTTSQK